MLKLLIAVFAIVGATQTFGQNTTSKSAPDFSKIDPAWAENFVDNDFQNGSSKSAWRAIKRDLPGEYQAFVVQYANVMIRHEDATAISGAFINKNIQSETPFAAQSPDFPLAQLQKIKAKVIEHLATYNVRACAAFSIGSSAVLAQELGHADGETMMGLYEIDGALFDAAAAGHAQPTPHRTIGQDDILQLEQLVKTHGGSEGEASAIFGRAALQAAETTQCRYGVLFYRALAAAPDEVSAKFAFR